MCVCVCQSDRALLQCNFCGEPTIPLVISGRKYSIHSRCVSPAPTRASRGPPNRTRFALLPTSWSPLFFSETPTLLQALPSFMILMTSLCYLLMDSVFVSLKSTFLFQGSCQQDLSSGLRCSWCVLLQTWHAPSGTQEQIGSLDFQTTPTPLLGASFTCSDVQTRPTAMPSLHSPRLLPALERIQRKSMTNRKIQWQPKNS